MILKTNTYFKILNDKNQELTVRLYGDGWYIEGTANKVFAKFKQTAPGRVHVEVSDYGTLTKYFEGDMTTMSIDKIYIKTFFNEIMSGWITRIDLEKNESYVRQGDHYVSKKSGEKVELEYSFDMTDGAWVVGATTIDSPIEIVSFLYAFKFFSDPEYEIAE